MLRFALVSLGLALTLACATRTSGPTPGDIAAAHSTAGRFEEAAREIDLAVRARPRDLSLRRQAAQIHSKANHSNQAIGHLEVAIQLAPQDGTLWIELAELELTRENIADAYVAYRRAATLAPNDLRAVSGLALAAEHLGFREEASAAYARWSELEQVIEQNGSD